jgi:hypothetical protein
LQPVLSSGDFEMGQPLEISQALDFGLRHLSD